MKSDPIVEYVFEPTIPKVQRDSMVLTLRKRGYVASRESDTLRTDATLEGIALAYGSNWFLKPRAANSHEALVSIAEGVLTALSYPRGSEAQIRCLEEVGQDAKAVLAKAKPTTTKEAFAQ